MTAMKFLGSEIKFVEEVSFKYEEYVLFVDVKNKIYMFNIKTRSIHFLYESENDINYSTIYDDNLYVYFEKGVEILKITINNARIEAKIDVIKTVLLDVPKNLAIPRENFDSREFVKSYYSCFKYRFSDEDYLIFTDENKLIFVKDCSIEKEIHFSNVITAVGFQKKGYIVVTRKNIVNEFIFLKKRI